MCGICGIMTFGASDEWKFDTLERLLLHSRNRGRDATGVGFFHPKNGLTVLKDSGSADEFIKTDDFKKLRGEIPNIIIGHARGASREFGIHGSAIGDPEDNKNNHPFYSKHSGIILVHNGKIDDDPWRKCEGIKYPFEGTTDSEAFLRVLETVHMEDGGDFFENIENTCLNMAGRYALAILKEDQPNKIWFVRHGTDTTISLGFIRKAKTIVFASTEQTIKSSLEVYKNYLNFFWETKLPESLVINSITDDHIVEVELKDNEKFKIRYQEGKFCDSQYSFHKKIAEKEKAEKEEIMAEGTVA